MYPTLVTNEPPINANPPNHKAVSIGSSLLVTRVIKLVIEIKTKLKADVEEAALGWSPI
jgi:hypothetical protein